MYNGSYYNATVSGARNLTEMIWYPPVAGILSVSVGYTDEATVFTTNSTDLNINGTGLNELNDSLTYLWLFGDDTNVTTTLRSATRRYPSDGTYTVVLVVTDAFNKTDNTSINVTIVDEPVVLPSGGGGGGGRYVYEAPNTVIEINFTSEGEEITLSMVSDEFNTAEFEYLDEAAIKQGVILKILSLLNWDPFNIDEIQPEYSVDNGKIDFALKHKKLIKAFICFKKETI